MKDLVCFDSVIKEGQIHPEISRQEMFTLPQLAERWNIHTRTIRRGVDAGRIPGPVRCFGRILRWYRKDIEAWEAGGCQPVNKRSRR